MTDEGKTEIKRERDCAHDTHVVRQYVDHTPSKIHGREQGPFDSCALSHYHEEDGRKSRSNLWQLLVRQIQYVCNLQICRAIYTERKDLKYT